MNTIQAAFDLIETMRRINQIADDNNLASGKRCRTSTFRELSQLLYKVRDDVGVSPDLFLAKLSLEIEQQEKLQSVIYPLMQELRLFCDWYNEHEETLEKLFSREAVISAAEEEAKKRYEVELQLAEEELVQASKDEDVCHDLVRAYNSRSINHLDGSALTKDDWNYISGSLAAYKKHFYHRVDLDGINDKYAELKRIKEECRAKILQIKKDKYDYSSAVEREFEEEVLTAVYGLVSPIIAVKPEKGPSIIEEARSKNTGRKAYPTYERLEDCISRKDVYQAISKVANYFYGKHSALTTRFGSLLFKKLKEKGWLVAGGCSMEHFGELLIKEFGDKCSFKKGKSIMDCEVKDLVFCAEMDKLFPKA